jgi:glycerol-3-phosphate dehydrogenase (NAD(P)+)
MVKLAILGAGAWGTALAIRLAGQHEVSLWGREADLMDEMRQQRVNGRFLPGHPLPPAILLPATAQAALQDAELVICAAPVVGLRSTLSLIHQSRPKLPVIWVCKGFEQKTGFLPHQVAHETLAAGTPCGVLSGPSFAEEVARGAPTAVTLASADADFAAWAARTLHNTHLRIYSGTDITGVELAGALKNVIAIASGMGDGLQLGYNARAALISRSLAEIARLGVRMGARPDTLMGLSGLGDLVLTCTGPLSRNYQVGQGLAHGKSLNQILGELGHVAEGVYTAAEALKLAHHHQVEMPIIQSVSQVLDGSLSVAQALSQLLLREQRSETE